MKQFSIIFKFELLGLLKSKSYIISTAIFIAVAIIGILIPTFTGGIDMFLPAKNDEGQIITDETFLVLDESEKDILKFFQQSFPNMKIEKAESVREIEKEVAAGTYNNGVVIRNNLDYTYYVKNEIATDDSAQIVNDILSRIKRNLALEEAGIDADKVMQINAKNVSQGSIIALDRGGGASVVAYSMGLMIVIYAAIISYGSMIATSVAKEKGNRTMELLVTSADSSALIFGKVLATIVAATLQIGTLILSATLVYQFFGTAWNGLLDTMFAIPMDVLVAFALFGVTGLFFYSFLYGALGALVSKTEEVNSATTPVTFVVIFIYIIAQIGISDPSSMLFKVASIVPLTSPIVMFVRMSMGEVPMAAVFFSFALLLITTILSGFFAARIYRRGTLMYGNEVKFIHILKWLKKEKQ
ncbi:MAG: ABC transporter permease [Breznakia sp.]